MQFPTPSDPRPVPHERGVFRDDDMFPGMVGFRVYNCVGDLVEMTFALESWLDVRREAELQASLDLRCPPGDHRHEDPPFPGRLPFTLLKPDIG